MESKPTNLTEEDGYAALRGHLVERALVARERYGPDIDFQAIQKILVDPEIVRFATEVVFDADPLLPGEFAWAQPKGDTPSAGYRLVVHPCFEQRFRDLPKLIAYHIVSINYLDIATHEEAELFGAALLGLEVDEYYATICALADSVPGAPKHDPDLPQRFEEAVSGFQSVVAGNAPAVPGGCSSGGNCSCGAD